jgi:hypothetical protein
MAAMSRHSFNIEPYGSMGLLINNKKTYHRCVCHQEHKLPLIQLGHLLINNKKHIIDVYVIKNQHADILKRTYLCQVSDTGSSEPLVCYLLTGALAGLVVACVLNDIHIYDMFCVIY